MFDMNLNKIFDYFCFIALKIKNIYKIIENKKKYTYFMFFFFFCF